MTDSVTELFIRLNKEKAALDKQIETLLALANKFPDLEISTRNNTVRYKSASVNSIAVDCHVVDTARRFGDTAYKLARPYVKVCETYVYSNPFELVVGRYSYSGFVEDPSWEERALSYGFTPQVINKIKESFYE